jgi:tetratricopeptide (TPR) repeat protein
VASTSGGDGEASGGNRRSERLSTSALNITFVGRRNEIDASRRHLLPADEQPVGRVLIIRGDSGSGKTFFARELMRRLHDAKPRALYLYMDVANDEYRSSRILSSILKIALVGGGMTSASTISVPEELTLQRYRKQLRRRGAARGVFRAVVRAVATVVGLGSAVNGALDESGIDGTANLEVELTKYLAWVVRNEAVFLTIDNVQFLNLELRLTLESIVDRVNRNVRFIAIDRTIDGVSTLDPPIRCFGDNHLAFQLGKMTPIETKELVGAAVGHEEPAVETLADDIFSKTDGLPKDIEYFLRSYVLEPKSVGTGGVEGLLAMIDRLPLIHRQFLVIATLLDGGVDKAIARNAVRRIAAVYDEAALDDAVDQLVARDYLRINTESGNRLRPGHERIVTAMRNLADDDLQEEVRRSLVQELAATLEGPDPEENETYLLHCLVGLQTIQELARSIHYISRLVQSQHRQDQFSYLVLLADELRDVLPLLPEHVLNDILDAMQKASAFERGLELLHTLESKGVMGAKDRLIYRFKYLTQAYRYEEALALSEQLEDNEWATVYRVIALMALSHNDEARRATEARLSRTMTEAQAVLRRNTVTLFDAETALQYLDEAYAYFERDQSDYRLATVDTNRGMVYLRAGRLGDALRVLERAVTRMHRVGSREIYQAQLNLAVREALVERFDAALEFLDEAAIQVPKALLLDKVKIRTNRAVVALVGGAISRDEAERIVADCLHRTRGVPMPYVRQVMRDNLTVLQGGPSPIAAAPGAILSLPLRDEASGSDARLTLMTTVHWRY